MTTVARCLGESLFIGDAAMTLRERRGRRVLVSLLVPAGTRVEIDGVRAEAAAVLSCMDWHMQWLLCGECLRVGKALVRIGTQAARKTHRSALPRQIRVAVEAPRSVSILRTDRRGGLRTVRAGGAAGTAGRRAA